MDSFTGIKMFTNFKKIYKFYKLKHSKVLIINVSFDTIKKKALYI